MTASASALLGLLVIAASAIASAAARLFKVPYVVGLVLAGLCIGLVHRPPGVFVPSTVLSVFLPPLLFAAAWEMDLRLLAKRWLPIGLLATVGVAIGMLVMYAVLRSATSLNPAAALMFGALVAATDPVAVIALFRAMVVDRGLATVVEGESLFNDGVAVVLVASILAGAGVSMSPVAVDAASIAVAAAMLTAGGALAGALVGFVAGLAVRIMQGSKSSDVPRARAVLAILVTCAAAYGAYGIAAYLHVSGIVAVIASGLACAWARGSDRSDAPADAAADRFWELAALAANSVLFVLVGLALDLRAMASLAVFCAWAVCAAVVARGVSVYGLCAVSRVGGSPIALRQQHVLALGGMRGALSMALALSLPASFPDRTTLVSMVYAVVFFTLVVQGLALRPAIVALNVGEREAAREVPNQQR